MRDRLGLHAILQNIIGAENKVYFQAPGKSKMTYPCIVYSLDDMDADYSSNKAYRVKPRYKVMLITNRPEPINGKTKDLIQLEASSFQQFYVADNLCHYVYQIYY